MRSLAASLLLVAALPTLSAQTAGPAAPAAAAAAPATWNIDPVHSELTFRVRHLTGRVRGTFAQWSGSIVVDPAQLDAGKATVEIKTASVDTDNADRDKHLASPDFFDAAKYPSMTFASRSVKVTGKTIELAGDLTIKGVTKPVVLKGTYGGTITDPWGAERIAFEAGTTINRREFGLTWSKLVEGVALVGDEITIDLAVEAVKQK